ncbi:MAG: nucleotidyltransferase domain-containing protein [Nitrospirales bacterium]|nr:nucleotidyltransferase domain-containing protein [Nitrospirales bacterium]
MQSDEIIEALSGVFKRHGDAVVFAYLFGSTARGETGPLSDVDVAVYLKGGTIEEKLEAKFGLYADFSRALKRNDIDVVVLNATDNLILLEEIVRHGKVIHDTDLDLRLDFEVKIIHRAIDFRTQRKAMMGV